MNMSRDVAVWALLLMAGVTSAGSAQAQGPDRAPVFGIGLMADREPAVAGEDLAVAVVLEVQRGWHVNSDLPGDEFSIPTSVSWQVPDGWSPPSSVRFPPGESLKFSFSEEPLQVWQGKVVILASFRVPAGATGRATVGAAVTAQACNNTQCLPPTEVGARLELQVAAPGGSSRPAHAELFAAARAATEPSATGAGRERAVGIGQRGRWAVGLLLVAAGALALVLVRPKSARPWLDRLVRALCAGAIVGGALVLPVGGRGPQVRLEWRGFDAAGIEAAASSGQPVILDFFADWCAPCRELDERTFSHPDVAAVLDGYARFKVDLTETNDAVDEVRRQYGVVGVPTVIVIKGGEEAFRITGFEPAGQFLGRLGGEVAGRKVDEELAGSSLPLQLLIVFLIGLGLNLTPCVYPLIPITVGFFSRQAEERSGGAFGLAVVYALGMSVTYSALGVIAALTGQLFGAALQNPLVVGGLVAVLLALAASMFGLWELRVPGWAMRVSGGKTGALGALIMGLVVGFVAAPCIGPLVLGLLTYVGQRGSPLLGFVLFFSLSMGLGLPYVILGTFTGLLNRLPASGAWMIGVRKVFGVLLVALAGYFAQPLLGAGVSEWALGVVLLAGGTYLLIVDRTGHDQPTIDRIMRLAAAAMVVVGALRLPIA